MLICGKPTKHRDQGWSWVVLFTSFTIQLLCDGSISAYGVVYAGVKNDTYFASANYTEKQITLPGAIQSCLYVIAMGFAGPIVNTLGFQLVACVSSLMAGLAMVAAVFFKDIAGMIVFYGVFSGK
ncbi:unnamed protein product [Hymenolepis diminuta]|uniref:MFS domain-containing protein n=1 Tax=Hymenolepis diminuta TaxID=6216 RepID=A0A564YIU8_HYMDI|nr:unnamed protein product [Hymenolepis diminuta]